MTTSEITSLSVEERLQLIEALWDSIAAEKGQPALTDAQIAELDRRMEAHAANPEHVIPWEQVKIRTDMTTAALPGGTRSHLATATDNDQNGGKKTTDNHE